MQNHYLSKILPLIVEMHLPRKVVNIEDFILFPLTLVDFQILFYLSVC
jgi:hypothetical protein